MGCSVTTTASRFSSRPSAVFYSVTISSVAMLKDRWIQLNGSRSGEAPADADFWKIKVFRAHRVGRFIMNAIIFCGYRIEMFYVWLPLTKEKSSEKAHFRFAQKGTNWRFCHFVHFTRWTSLLNYVISKHFLNDISRLVFSCCICWSSRLKGYEQTRRGSQRWKMVLKKSVLISISHLLSHAPAGKPSDTDTHIRTHKQALSNNFICSITVKHDVCQPVANTIQILDLLLMHWACFWSCRFCPHTYITVTFEASVFFIYLFILVQQLFLVIEFLLAKQHWRACVHHCVALFNKKRQQCDDVVSVCFTLNL